MQLEWKRITGDLEPQLIDDTSSPTSVYLHKNAEQVEIPSEREGEEPRTQWVYDEIILSKEDFENLKKSNKKFREGLEKGKIVGI